MEKLNIALIVIVIVLIGALGVAFGYEFFAKNNTTSNQTPTNVTNVTNQTIPYSSEYITFTKAKSIAKSYAAKGVTTSDPILVKAKNGDAVYYSTYTYNGAVIGGIIINAKTGKVLAIQQDVPNQTVYTTSPNYSDSGSNYDDSGDYQSDQSSEDNSDDSGDYSDTSDTDDTGDTGNNGYTSDTGDTNDY